MRIPWEATLKLVGHDVHRQANLGFLSCLQAESLSFSRASFCIVPVSQTCADALCIATKASTSQDLQYLRMGRKYVVLNCSSGYASKEKVITFKVPIVAQYGGKSVLMPFQGNIES